MSWPPGGLSSYKMRKLVKLFSLLPEERRLLFSALALLGLVRLGLWFLPYRIQKPLFFSPKPDSPGPPLAATIFPEQIAWAVKTASHYVPKASCLPQALVAKMLLARAGQPADLHLGVAKGQDGKFEAHAWVESAGQVVIGGHEPGFYAALTNL